MMTNRIRFSDCHRLLLQDLLHVGAIPILEFLSLFHRYFIATTPIRDQRRYPKLINFNNDIERDRVIDTIIDECNVQLALVGFRMRRTTDDYDCTTQYIFSESSFAESLAVASSFTDDELELFKKWLDVIMGTGNGSIQLSVAIEELPNRMTRSKVDAFISRMIANRWLDETSDSIRLHQRAIIELHYYLCQQYSPDICPLCRQIVIHSTKHSTCEQCNTRVHEFCKTRLRQATIGVRARCPGKISSDGSDCTFEYATIADDD